LPLTSNQRKEKLESLLEDFRMTHLRKSLGYQLSGGERRRTEIARALCTDPGFILLDEPFAGVDPIAVEDIMMIVAGLKNRGIGVLITDHNVHETLSIVDKAYILISGVIFRFGGANELAEDEDVRKMYLGENFKQTDIKKNGVSRKAWDAPFYSGLRFLKIRIVPHLL